jgi:outer membrane lipoprotein-sorting protein
MRYDPGFWPIAPIARAAVWAALVVLGAPTGLSAQQSRALDALELAASRYRSAPTLCADFVQRMSVPLLGEERTGRGHLCQAQPDLFAMRFSDPDGDLVVVDGTWVWLYTPSLDSTQVFRFPMTQAPQGFDFHREFLERPAERYEVSWEAEDEVEGSTTDRIRLVPLALDASYDAAVVWVDRARHLLLRVRVEEENGSVRTVTLDNVRLGAPVPDGWFTFAPPPGAQVISR